MSAALRWFGLLSVWSNTPASPSLRVPCIHTHSRRFVASSHEISRLVISPFGKRRLLPESPWFAATLITVVVPAVARWARFLSSPVASVFTIATVESAASVSVAPSVATVKPAASVSVATVASVVPIVAILWPWAVKRAERFVEGLFSERRPRRALAVRRTLAAGLFKKRI